MNTLVSVLIVILLLNVITAIITVFKEERDITATWAWLLVLNLLPVIGFGIYLLVGKKISKEKMFDLKMQERLGIDQLVELQKEQWQDEELLQKDCVHQKRAKQSACCLKLIKQS